MKSKFTKVSDDKAKSALGSKLEAIASLLADEILANSRSEGNDGGFSFDEKLGALKTLTTYYATVAKVDPPEDEGNGFAQFRKQVAASDSGRGRDSDGFSLSGEVE